MGTENSGQPTRPAYTPFAAAPRTMSPFSSSGPIVGAETSVFRPSPPVAPQNFMSASSSSPLSGSQASGFRSMPPVGFNNPSLPPAPASNFPAIGGSFQQYTTPQFTPARPFSGQPPVQPLGSQVTPATVPYHSQSQIPPPSVAPPVHNLHPPPNTNIPPSLPDASFTAPRQNFQQSFPGYVRRQPNTDPLMPPIQPSFVNQGRVPPSATTSTFTNLPHQGGYGPPPPNSQARGPMQHVATGPPTGPLQGLIEDFSSLNVGSIPGSIDVGIDPKALPRPLNGDEEPKLLSEMFSQNCHSRYLRLTTSGIPNSQSLVSRWHLPLGAVICPLAEAPDGEEVPIVNFASTGIIRCRRCRTYVNPYATFTDSGRKWRCSICSLLNDVPGEYFSHLDAAGRRMDLDQRPELTNGSVEFVAPTEYMVRPPMPPQYFFLIDVSASTARSGMLEVVAKTIRSCLDKLPGFPRTQIGFATFDSTIHFYNMKSSLTQPQMMVVSDLDDVFVPLPDDLLVNLSESRSVVETFLDSLPSMFQDNVNVESAFGPALKAAFMVMSPLGGKLLIFQNTLPSLGVGRLKLRGDDLRIYGTDKEPALRVPEDPFYKQMAAEFTKFQIGVDIFAFSDKYTDIASLGALAKYTGGQVYYYPGFQSAIHGEKLRHELGRDLTRETAWEAVLRIRCGKGVRFTSYHGNFMLRSTDLLSLPAVDCDKAFAMQLSLEETLLTTQTVYFQVALLYTASCGERRIRVHTAAAPVVTDLGEMYRQADVGAVLSLFSRLGISKRDVYYGHVISAGPTIEKTLSHKLEDARTSVQQRIVKALREYRNLYAVQHRLGGRLIYPESLRFLPLYGLALCKSVALRGGYADASLDERCASGHSMMIMPVSNLLKLLYPSLIRLDNYLFKGTDFKSIGENLPLATDSLDSRGLYLYDDGLRFIVWFGRALSPDVAMNLLGTDFATELSKVILSRHDNEMSKKLTTALDKFRERDPSYYQLCHLVRQGEQPREGFLLLTNLVEEQMGGTNGYVDWILQMHRQVQQNA